MSAPGCHIRACVPADERALALVGPASFLEAYAGILRAEDILEHCERTHSLAAYRRWLADPDIDAWIVEADPGRAPVGYLLLTPVDLPLAELNPTDLEIRRIYLLHRFQGGGLGRQLMDLACERARERGAGRVLLGVYSQNHAALGFYQALGFRPIGRRTFHVGSTDCEDLILALPLSPP